MLIQSKSYRLQVTVYPGHYFCVSNFTLIIFGSVDLYQSLLQIFTPLSTLLVVTPAF